MKRIIILNNAFEGLEATRQCYNAKGQRVKSVEAKHQMEVRIDISKLASGLYLVRAYDAKGKKKEGRFVK